MKQLTTIDDNTKKILKHTGLIAKVHGRDIVEIDFNIQVDNDGSFEVGWNGDDLVLVSNKKNTRKYETYEPYSEFIWDLVSRYEDVFLEPFDEFSDESWGDINIKYDLVTKLITFRYSGSYYYTREYETDGVTTEFSSNFKLKYPNILDSKIRVKFQGSGDDGYVERLGENPYNDEIQVPNEVRDLVADILSSNYGGWELDAGSYGYVVLDFNQEYVEYEIFINLNDTESFAGHYDFVIQV